MTLLIVLMSVFFISQLKIRFFELIKKRLLMKLLENENYAFSLSISLPLRKRKRLRDSRLIFIDFHGNSYYHLIPIFRNMAFIS